MSQYGDPHSYSSISPKTRGGERKINTLSRVFHEMAQVCSDLRLLYIMIHSYL